MTTAVPASNRRPIHAASAGPCGSFLTCLSRPSRFVVFPSSIRSTIGEAITESNPIRHAWPHWRNGKSGPQENVGRQSPSRSRNFMTSADSVLELFGKPWPDSNTRPKIKTWTDGAKSARLLVRHAPPFRGTPCRDRRRWPMFSPSVDWEHLLTRPRPLYDDDSDVIRQTTGPRTLRPLSRWFNDKCTATARGRETDDEGAARDTAICSSIAMDKTPTAPSSSRSCCSGSK